MAEPQTGRPRALGLPRPMVTALRSRLPEVAGTTVAAVLTEVPGYSESVGLDYRANIENAVRMALAGFLELAALTDDDDPAALLAPAKDAAYALGRGEARSGRTMDALLSAYRVGARVSWRQLAVEAMGLGLADRQLVDFAELTFAYIDELSAASVLGHSDELTTAGRARERLLELLARALLGGADPALLVAAAERAQWPAPATLTPVLLPASGARSVPTGLPSGSLRLDADDGTTVLLVPESGGARRPALLRLLAGRPAVVGPARPWQQVAAGHARALRTLQLVGEPTGPVDTEEHLVDLVLTADPEALADLRARVLAPLADLRPDSADKLTATLRAWLVHQGRREEMAAELFVHPQTVRYRMGQLRSLFGESLDDPGTRVALVTALAGRAAPSG